MKSHKIVIHCMFTTKAFRTQILCNVGVGTNLREKQP